MLFFINNDSKKIIGTNYKVMSSSFRSYDNYKPIRDEEINLDEFIYVLGRNPYDRAESFYRDKFNKGLESNDDNIWYRWHKIFFPSLGITHKLSEQVKKDAFKNLTFENFIKLLPNHYYKNNHLFKQTRKFKDYKNVHKLKLESNDDMTIMKEVLEINTEIIKNKTNKKNYNLNWTLEMRKIINKIYYEDFQYFNYKMI